MTTRLTADEHYAHHNIGRYCNRPFADVVEMEREMIARHNAVVKPDDLTIHVGDFSLAEGTVPKVLAQLNGRKILVSGNHDRTHVRFGNKSEPAIRRYLGYGFESVVTQMELGPFLVTHMPYHGDDRVKYHQYRPVDKGRWLLCGHIHNLFRTRDRMINVGVDVWDFTPVSLETCVRLMENPE